MKKPFYIYASAIILSIGLAVSGCGAGSRSKASYDAADAMEDPFDESGNSMTADMDNNASASESQYQTESAAVASESQYQTESAAAASAAGADIVHTDSNNSVDDTINNAANTNATAQDATKKNNANEKLIYTYHYSVETKAFDSFTGKITEKTNQLGGYIESSETNGSSSDDMNRYANITLRIPADQMGQLLSVIDTEANVTYSSSNVENITLEYVDMQSHIKALRTEQNTLLELIEKADKLKDIIALQSQLTQVRYEIESYESRLRTYDNLVTYSTLNLSIQEVQRTSTVTSSKTSFTEEVKNKFSDNLYAVGQWLRALVIWLIGSLPILLPAILAAVIIILLFRKWRKNHQKNYGATASQPASDTQHGYQSIYHSKKTESKTNKNEPDQSDPDASDSKS